MRYVTLIFLLMLLSVVMGHGIFAISLYVGFGHDNSRIMSVGSGIFIGAAIWVWGALDKGRNEGSDGWFG